MVNHNTGIVSNKRQTLFELMSTPWLFPWKLKKGITTIIAIASNACSRASIYNILIIYHREMHSVAEHVQNHRREFQF